MFLIMDIPTVLKDLYKFTAFDSYNDLAQHSRHISTIVIVFLQSTRKDPINDEYIWIYISYF